MTKTEILEILYKHDFIVQKSEIFISNLEEFIHCVNLDRQISLIIKEYSQHDLSNVSNDVMKVRRILRENNANIWNSYFLILLSSFDNFKDLKVYSIERNAQGLRKYVIVSENDLYRIPFIENIEENNISLNFAANFSEFFKTNDIETQGILEWIIDSDGEFVEIKKNLIKEKVKEIIKG
ncbi:ABC-three component system middle component 1 [Paenibacillus alvei]